MNIRIVIASIGTQMLLTRWAWHHDRENQVIGRPFVVFVGARDMNGQRRAPFIHQNVGFAPLFGSIGRVLSRLIAAQRCRTRFAINRLLFPADALLTRVEADQGLEHFLPDPSLLPRLKTLVQHAAGHIKPVAMYSFPLAAGPQNVPNAIDHVSIVHGRSSRASFRRWFRQMFLDAASQWTRNVKIVHIFRFYARLFCHGVTSLCLVLDDLSYSRLRHFYHCAPIFG